jgi:NAD(P)-dependent dehydrogenase (short-subunit alcohol dehydrogenase family)
VPRLDAKTALITGASAGQGEAESRLFAAHNAHVVAADIDVDRGRQVAAELGDRAIFVRARQRPGFPRRSRRPTASVARQCRCVEPDSRTT